MCGKKGRIWECTYDKIKVVKSWNHSTRYERTAGTAVRQLRIHTHEQQHCCRVIPVLAAGVATPVFLCSRLLKKFASTPSLAAVPGLLGSSGCDRRRKAETGIIRLQAINHQWISWRVRASVYVWCETVQTAQGKHSKHTKALRSWRITTHHSYDSFVQHGALHGARHWSKPISSL